MTSLKNMLQMNSPQKFCLCEPTTWNPDQKRFHYTLRLHTRLWNLFQQTNCCEHHWHVNITLPFSSIFWVGSLFLIKFGSPFLIWLSFVDSIWLIFLIWLTIFLFESTFKIKIHSYFLIQFDSIFRFHLTTTTSILLTVSNLNQFFWFSLTHDFSSN